ncbi:hypothetical protein MTO96_029777, partial [Rhipicephalus appendiculatus]
MEGVFDNNRKDRVTVRPKVGSFATTNDVVYLNGKYMCSVIRITVPLF